MGEGRLEPEIVTLTLPCEERFIGVARIVVGGLAARLDLPYESLDDLQLAVETVLSERVADGGEDITVELGVFERRIEVSIGPLELDSIKLALDGGEPDGLGLSTLLGAVVDEVAFERRADGEWLRLHKQAPVLPRS
jgi:anti-sigma regulatory factor (Ser/Thr protein kinase)